MERELGEPQSVEDCQYDSCPEYNNNKNKKILAVRNVDRIYPSETDGSESRAQKRRRKTQNEYRIVLFNNIKVLKVVVCEYYYKKLIFSYF